MPVCLPVGATGASARPQHGPASCPDRKTGPYLRATDSNLFRVSSNFRPCAVSYVDSRQDCKFCTDAFGCSCVCEAALAVTGVRYITSIRSRQCSGVARVASALHCPWRLALRVRGFADEFLVFTAVPALRMGVSRYYDLLQRSTWHSVFSPNPQNGVT